MPKIANRFGFIVQAAEIQVSVVAHREYNRAGNTIRYEPFKGSERQDT